MDSPPGRRERVSRSDTAAPLAATETRSLPRLRRRKTPCIFQWVCREHHQPLQIELRVCRNAMHACNSQSPAAAAAHLRSCGQTPLRLLARAEYSTTTTTVAASAQRVARVRPAHIYATSECRLATRRTHHHEEVKPPAEVHYSAECAPACQSCCQERARSIHRHGHVQEAERRPKHRNFVHDLPPPVKGAMKRDRPYSDDEHAQVRRPELQLQRVAVTLRETVQCEGTDRDA
jgi:hypothetical protein